MTTSEQRWVHPAENEDPRDLDDTQAHAERVEHRQTTHDQPVERSQGLSSDRPGLDPSDREREIDGVDATYPSEAADSTD